MTSAHESQLVRLSEAERILAESTDLSELRKVHDVAQAAQAFARAHALGVEAEKHAFVIRTNAGIRLAELCPPKPPKDSGKAGSEVGGKGRPGKDAIGHSRRETPITPPLPAPRLSEYRRLAELPKQEVARRLDDAAERDSLSMRTLLKRNEKTQPQRPRKPNERRPAPEPVRAQEPPHANELDPFAVLSKLRTQREELRAYEFARLALRSDNEGHRIVALVLDGGELAMARLGLGWDSTAKDLKHAQKAAALSAHPDRGGSAETMARINRDCDLLRAWFAGDGQ